MKSILDIQANPEKRRTMLWILPDIRIYYRAIVITV